MSADFSPEPITTWHRRLFQAIRQGETRQAGEEKPKRAKITVGDFLEDRAVGDIFASSSMGGAQRTRERAVRAMINGGYVRSFKRGNSQFLEVLKKD